MPFPRDDTQHGLLESRSVRQHFPQLFPYCRYLRLDPRFALLIDDEGLGHASGESLLRGGSRGEVEQELEEDEVLDEDLAAKG